MSGEHSATPAGKTLSSGWRLFRRILAGLALLLFVVFWVLPGNAIRFVHVTAEIEIDGTRQTVAGRVLCQVTGGGWAYPDYRTFRALPGGWLLPMTDGGVLALYHRKDMCDQVYNGVGGRDLPPPLPVRPPLVTFDDPSEPMSARIWFPVAEDRPAPNPKLISYDVEKLSDASNRLSRRWHLTFPGTAGAQFEDANYVLRFFDYAELDGAAALIPFDVPAELRGDERLPQPGPERFSILANRVCGMFTMSSIFDQPPLGGALLAYGGSAVPVPVEASRMPGDPWPVDFPGTVPLTETEGVMRPDPEYIGTLLVDPILRSWDKRPAWTAPIRLEDGTEFAPVMGTLVLDTRSGRYLAFVGPDYRSPQCQQRTPPKDP